MSLAEWARSKSAEWRHLAEQAARVRRARGWGWAFGLGRRLRRENVLELARLARRAEADVAVVRGAQAQAVRGAQAQAVPGAQAQAVPGAQAQAVPGAQGALRPEAAVRPGAYATLGESAPDRFAPSESAPDRFAPSESAPDRFAPSESAPNRFAPSESAPDRFAPSEPVASEPAATTDRHFQHDTERDCLRAAPELDAALQAARRALAAPPLAFPAPAQLPRLLAAYLLTGFPRDVRAAGGAIAIAGALVLVPAAISFLAVWRAPPLASALAPRALAAVVESLRELGRASPDATLSALATAFYVHHNLSVALLAFVLGIPLGVGSPPLLIQNGVYAGVVAALAVQAGAGAHLCAFVAPHAPWEFLAIFVAAGAGLRLGHALLAPGFRTRAAALRALLPASLRLLAGSALLLAVAGLLEGLVAPAALRPAAKLAVGAASALLLLVWIARAQRPEPAP